MLITLVIVAWLIDVAAALLLIWRMAQLGPRRHGIRGMLLPVGVLALMLIRSAQRYQADHRINALTVAAWPIVLIGGGYGLIFLVAVIAKPRWN